MRRFDFICSVEPLRGCSLRKPVRVSDLAAYAPDPEGVAYLDVLIYGV